MDTLTHFETESVSTQYGHNGFSRDQKSPKIGRYMFRRQMLYNAVYSIFTGVEFDSRSVFSCLTHFFDTLWRKNSDFGMPRGIRTPDLLVRSQTLYPAELWAQVKVLYDSITDKIKNKASIRGEKLERAMFIENRALSLNCYMELL